MTYSLQDLLYLMQRLRNPLTGCPWDVKQDFTSVMPYTLEEAYEVADAIEKQNWPHLEEELGDLLFQVVFHGRIGEERGLFKFDSIVHRLVEKLVRRHPHVFPDGTLQSERDPSIKADVAEQQVNWDAIKQQEKAQAGAQTQAILDDVPVMPAISRAVKMQKKVAKVGFDWPNVQGVLDKIKEELAEVEAELISGDKTRQQEEIGDLLFAVTNLARHLKIDPESALRGTNTRFEQRFGLVEQHINQQGGFSQASPESLEAAWQQAKKTLATANANPNKSIS